MPEEQKPCSTFFVLTHLLTDKSLCQHLPHLEQCASSVQTGAPEDATSLLPSWSPQSYWVGSMCMERKFNRNPEAHSKGMLIQKHAKKMTREENFNTVCLYTDAGGFFSSTFWISLISYKVYKHIRITLLIIKQL